MWASFHSVFSVKSRVVLPRQPNISFITLTGRWPSNLVKHHHHTHVHWRIPTICRGVICIYADIFSCRTSVYFHEKMNSVHKIFREVLRLVRQKCAAEQLCGSIICFLEVLVMFTKCLYRHSQQRRRILPKFSLGNRSSIVCFDRNRCSNLSLIVKSASFECSSTPLPPFFFLSLSDRCQWSESGSVSSTHLYLSLWHTFYFFF